MKINFFLILFSTISCFASSEQLFELEKKHLDNQKKIVELGSTISGIEIKMSENSDFVHQKTDQLAKRLAALNSIQRQQWGILLFGKNLTSLQKNLTLFKLINSRDIQMLGEYKYAQSNLLVQKQSLEQKRDELLQIDKLISKQQKDIQGLELAQIAELKKENLNSLLLQKGLLLAPIAGVVKNSYGSKQDDLKQFSYFISGLYFLTQPNSQVKTIAAGRVVFADFIPFRGLSVIVEHPGKYFSVYSNLVSTTAVKDTDIDQDFTLGQTASADFYFELRHKNISIDPKNWLKVESKGQL